MTVRYAYQVFSCSATKEATTSLNEPMRPTLDEALEYVVDDELVEVRVKPIPSHVSSQICSNVWFNSKGAAE